MGAQKSCKGTKKMGEKPKENLFFFVFLDGWAKMHCREGVNNVITVKGVA